MIKFLFLYYWTCQQHLILLIILYFYTDFCTLLVFMVLFCPGFDHVWGIEPRLYVEAVSTHVLPPWGIGFRSGLSWMHYFLCCIRPLFLTYLTMPCHMSFADHTQLYQPPAFPGLIAPTLECIVDAITCIILNNYHYYYYYSESLAHQRENDIKCRTDL